MSVAEIEIRAPSEGDAEAIADALNALGRSLYGTDDTTGEEIRAWFSSPDLDPAVDMRVAALPDGSIAAYADLGGGYGDPMRLWLDLRVRPGYEAAGPPLLAVMERRACERATAPGGALLRGIVPDRDAVGGGLLRDAGMRVVRSSFRMTIDLDSPPAQPAWPAGLSVRTLGPEEGDERVFAAHQDGFADHWEFHPTPIDEWRHWMLRPPHDPSLWFLVEDRHELVAICLCRPHETGDPDMGWINVLAVRSPWRRRGIARALLLHAFSVFRERGTLRAGLGVDAENTTGAVALYEGAGMLVARRADTYEKAV